MIDLNKEAKNLADNESLFRDGLLTLCNKKLFIKGAIAGANSKFVKQQLLLAQIDILKKLSIDTVYFYNTKEGRFTKKLQEKLKQLQDE